MNRLKSIGRIAGYVAFFMVVFLVSLLAKFPTETAVRWAVSGLEQNLKMKVEIAQIERYRLTGVRLSGVALSWDKERDFEFARLDELQAWVNPLPLLWGRTSLRLSIKAYGGELHGRVVRSGAGSDVLIELENLDLARLNLPGYIPGELAEFRAAGRLSGLADLHLKNQPPTGPAEQSTGKLDLTLDGLALSEIKLTIPLAGPLEIDPLSFEPSKLALELDRSSLRINEGTLKGPQTEVVLSGKMIVNSRDFMKSNYAFTAKFRLGPEFDQKYGLALGVAAAQLNLRKDAEGFYRLDLRGTPSSPRIQQFRQR